MNFLLAEANPGGATQWILPAVLLVLVIGIFILNYFRSKKSREQMKNILDSIKVGDKVKTYSGIYGKVIEITETTDGKVATLETGNENNVGYISIDMNAIYSLDEKKPVVLDAEGNIIEPKEATEEPKEQTAETTQEEQVKTEEAKEEKAETPLETEKKEPEKKTKKRAKKADKQEN